MMPYSGVSVLYALLGTGCDDVDIFARRTRLLLRTFQLPGPDTT